MMPPPSRSWTTICQLLLRHAERRGRTIPVSATARCFASHRTVNKIPIVSTKIKEVNEDDHWSSSRVNAFVGHSFPDFIESWNRDVFRRVGYLLSTVTAGLAVAPAVLMDATTVSSLVPAALVGAFTAGYWKVGLQDIRQTSHAIRRNFPVLGNVRYILETIRPELRQYIVESDDEGKPFSRLERVQVYQRAKHVNDTLPFGTRRNVYEANHEWACHSMFPVDACVVDARRCTVGTAVFGTTQPYSASLFNISAMSYGAISDAAILALNRGAQLGHFYHNTGEGGVSQHHRTCGGDIVWNIGTGYFGCGSTNAANGQRVFEPAQFQETMDEARGQIKMIELKLSQGAKPGHGGLLPRSKITPDIARARKLAFPPTGDCHSPARHSSFGNVHEMVQFIATLRQLSGGLPVGIKLCVGEPAEMAALVQAIEKTGTGPDFITVDGSEGGTGAAPPELSDHIGLPLEEGLVLVRDLLEGAGLRDQIRINASGKISSGFGIVKTLALGADLTSAARAFMMSLGCIQALKCNTNKCPTGIATQNKELMFGLCPEEKAVRVYHYHYKTLESAADILGIIGHDEFSKLSPSDIMRRVGPGQQVSRLSEVYPLLEPGCLIHGNGPDYLQHIWDSGAAMAKTL